MIVEALRIQDYWNICGIRDGLFLKYARHEGNTLDFVRCATQGFCFSSDKKIDTLITFDHININWIDNQKNYLKNKIQQKYKILLTLNKISKYLFFTGISFLFVAGLSDVYNHYNPHIFIKLDNISNILEHLSEICIGIAALSATYVEFSGNKEDTEDYKRSLDRYEGAKIFTKDKQFGENVFRNLLEKHKNKSSSFLIHEFKNTLYHLGIEVANGDNARWLMRSLKQKIDLMKG